MSEFVSFKRIQIERLIKKAELLDDGGDGADPETARSIADELRAVLAQEACTSCDGSGEYIDAIGDWRGYCSCPAGVELKNRPAQEAGHVEPVYQVRYLGDGGAGWSVVDKDAFNLDLHHKNYQSHTVFTSPPAQVSVRLPPYRVSIPAGLESHSDKQWNAALDKVKELNQ